MGTGWCAAKWNLEGVPFLFENTLMNRLCKTAFQTKLFTVILSCLLIRQAAALDTTDPNKAFVGTWQAQFQGKAFVTIKLEEQDAFTEAKLSDKILHLTSKGADAQDVTQYEMEINGADQAELRFVGLPAGVAAPKPWTLHRPGTATRPLSVKDKLANAAQIWMAGQSGNTATAAGSTATPASSAAPASTAAAAVPALKVSDTALDADLRKALDALPRRINDQFNNLGDMVNFVMVGSQQQVQTALEAATWNMADVDSKESALKAVLETYQKKDYLSMPMSRLYLYGRVQDYGYEMAEPYAVVASRHHFRMWKAPFTWNGQTVWIGAGTHDIGFEKDQRNGKVTHKIDPAVDGERDNVGASLQKTDKIKTMSYYLPPNPVQATKNATGGEYHS